MQKFRIAVAGCGFWAQYQISAWKELKNVEVVAVADPAIEKAELFQKRFDIGKAFADVGQMLKETKPDALDVITSSESHADLIGIAIEFNTPVICQKPLTPSWIESKKIVQCCSDADVPLFVHENWRFQAPMRKIKTMLSEKIIGEIFRARITCSHAFPVFDNQPFLRDIEQMVIADLGVHLLDTARFFFGEAKHLFAQVTTATQGVKGEDVATIILSFAGGCTCIVELSVATRQEIPHFPQTLVHLEGTRGVISLKEDYQISIVTDKGVERMEARPRHFAWVHPDYAVVQSSIYDCNKSILNALTNTGAGETTGEDNLETLRLAYAAYESAYNNRVITIADFA